MIALDEQRRLASLLAVCHAIMSGAPLLTRAIVEPGTVLLIDGKVYFHSDAERDSALTSMGFPVARP